MYRGCAEALLARYPSYQVRIQIMSTVILRALHVPLPSSFKSIEACAGKVSRHQMAWHFNFLHFLGQPPGEPEQDVPHPRVHVLS